MRKLFVLAGVALTALLVWSSPASASSTTCNSTLTGATIPDDLVVPEDGSCTIIGSTVGDDVKVGKNAYFESSGSTIGDDVEASRAQTVFIHDGSSVGDDIKTSKTVQVFLFDSNVAGDVEVRRSTAVVNVCGLTVDGHIYVKDSGTDILVGDPLTIGCAGNTVTGNHDVEIERNYVDVELIVRGNNLDEGDLEVENNTGPADKAVEDNNGGDDLECFGNEDPFTASGNTGWEKTKGQCAIPDTECNDANPQSVTAPGDLVVPENGVCIIAGSTVGGNVYVGKNAYFESIGSSIAADVKGKRSLTVFLHDGTTVGGDVETSSTFQVFVFDSSVAEDISVSRTSDTVNVCGNQVTGNVQVKSSGRDILVGDPASGCSGNTVGDEIEVERNNTDVELIVRGNTVTNDLEVNDNRGSSDKFVQDNTGGGTLECGGNQQPFVGSPNAGFTDVSGGQCALI